MDNLLERFLNKIGLKDLTPFEEGSFSKIENDRENNMIRAKMLLPSYLRYKDYMNLFDTISTFTSTIGGFGISLSFEYKDDKNGMDKLLEDFCEDHSCMYLGDVEIMKEENRILFYYPSVEYATSITDEAKSFTDFLDCISSPYHVLTQEKVYFDDDFADRRDEEYQQTTVEYTKKYKEMEEIQTHYQPCKLKDIEKFRMVVVEGKIFKLGEARKTKKGALIQPIEYADDSDAISSTFVEGKKWTADEIAKYTVGTKIRVRGKPKYDKFNHDELTLDIDDIEILDPDPIREDTYPEKRVELHLHSKMSPFDGVTSITDYAKRAAKWGHKAIAITDHGNVQAFPEAQKVQKSTGIKMIYGTELYVVNKKFNYIFNPSKRKLKNETYVVFDTETTGLSCRYDRLLEFGAVKIDNSGQILDEVDFFINPDMKISGFAVEKSHIRQQDVDRGKSIKQALRDILEFFGDSILVAHNAAFDFDFINEALKNNGMNSIQNPVIDTLPLARYMFDDIRNYREETIARKLDIEFDSTSAHRANYDAAHLAQIFDVMLSKLVQDNPDITHEELASLPVSKEMMLGLHPYHATVYAKNMEGLKDLYNLISESNTTYLSKDSPLIPRHILFEKRENILIGSGCLNGEVFENAMTKSKEKVKELIKDYDFIEVQPPENYLYLIHKAQLTDMDSVKKVLKDLIDVAREMGKIVVATGDCHYLDPEDKIYRDVFISAKGLKGARHPLNLAPYDSASNEVKQAWYKNPLPNPDQHFRTTDEMIHCFDFLNDLKLQEEIVIKNSNLIADMIDGDIKPTKSGTYPPKIEGCEQMLQDLVYKTAKEMYGDPLPDLIQERLDTELKGIIGGGYSVIYWLSSVIVRWSNSEGYLIGSRGSVGSSLVATFSGITEVNPLPPHYRCPHCHYLEWTDVKQYSSGFDMPAKKCPNCGADLIGDGQNIPFATFLGFKAEKTPDIDLNFPSDFQSIAHEHMKELLNSSGNTCYKAGTIQTTQEKQARGYVLGYYESLGKDTSKIRSAQIDRVAAGCIDVKRSTGQHPGGVIVIPAGMEASDFTPVQYPADDPDSSWKTTHYDFHAIHDNVLKFDMLGHVDPQAIKMMCDLAGISFMELRDKIPINDPQALSLFEKPDALKLKHNVLEQKTGALGLPEFGTENGRRTLLETKPVVFSDLVRISGLSHGTNVFAGNAEDLIVNEGYKLSDVICCRDDIMINLHDLYGMDFNDTFKLMEIVRKGNFTKKGFEDVRAKYTQMMKEHGVPEYFITSCEKIQYLFPRAHAVAYVTQALRCAWFKVYRPLEYYAVYFTLRCDGYDIETMCKGLNASLKKRNNILERLRNREPVSNPEQATINALESTIEMYDRGYEFEHIDIQKSEATRFTVDKKTGKVLPAFTAINGLGASVAEQIVKARQTGGEFTSIEDLKIRARVGDKMIDSLKKVHALDGLPEEDQISLF
ncbi:MAG: PolC-type DNA polymerase III [Bacilli bacterium]|nr:PolC-type DNA polymerase III [Bacilli bacterium]